MKTLEKITIKKVTIDDWEKFRDIRLKGLQTDPQAFGGVYSSESQGDSIFWQQRICIVPDRFYYAVEENGVFIAIGGTKKVSDNVYMIIAVYTILESRGQGISSKLLSAIMEDVKTRGVSIVSLMVNVHQHTAVNLYKKLGFEIIRTEKDQKMGDGNLYDEYYMEKVLK